MVRSIGVSSVVYRRSDLEQVGQERAGLGVFEVVD